jgi:hypothetical protein
MADSARHAILSETPTFDAKTGALRIVIETPKGSRNKYDYDPDCDCIELGAAGGNAVPPRFQVRPIDGRRRRRSTRHSRPNGCAGHSGLRDPGPAHRRLRPSRSRKAGIGYGTTAASLSPFILRHMTVQNRLTIFVRTWSKGSGVPRQRQPATRAQLQASGRSGSSRGGKAN